jgi:DNA-binding GntR family transcriptional regulator
MIVDNLWRTGQHNVLLNATGTRMARGPTKRRARVAHDVNEDSRAEIEAVIAERIRTAILSGALPPGTKLGEEAIAEAFLVSRFRVRSVLWRLAYENLVELHKNRGAFIAKPSVKEARDVFEARRVIERVTTEIATRTILTMQIDSLRSMLEAQERALAEGDRGRAIREASEFHRSLSGLAHNSALTAALEPLILRTSLIVALYGSPRVTLQSIRFHRELLHVIERGESLFAARTMERCLFAIERELNLGKGANRTVDLARVLGSVG